MENILNYPISTIVGGRPQGPHPASGYGRNIPKKAFYEHWDLSAKQRQHFVDDIASLTWLYKLGKGTANVPGGKHIVEIDFFAVVVKEQNCPNNVFTLIDSFMPQYIVFIQCYNDEYRLLLNYKDRTKDESHPFRIIKTFKGEWTKADDLRLTIAGNTLDDVWEHFAGIISDYHHLFGNHTCHYRPWGANQAEDQSVWGLAEENQERTAVQPTSRDEHQGKAAEAWDCFPWGANSGYKNKEQRIKLEGSKKKPIFAI